ncbi:Uncharacterised protein [Serratia liquefaciens]|nr:Uncharacterised protein [Serratia liquefaciens]
MSDFYYGQGKLYLARRNSAGQALSWRWVGDVSALAIEIEFDEKKTKMSLGGRLIDSQRYITSASAKVTSTWHEYSTENLQLLFLSGATNQASAIVTANFYLPTLKREIPFHYAIRMYSALSCIRLSLAWTI